MVTPTNYRIVVPAGALHIAGGKNLIDPPATPQDIGTAWYFYGDSETEGRALETSVTNQVEAFQNIWNQTNSVSISPAIVDGVGGRTLDGSQTAYLADSTGSATWVHFQDSGSQSGTTATASGFAAVFESFVDNILSNTPDAIISTETAYSFEEVDGSGRYWPAWNAAMKESIATYAASGTYIFCAEVDRNITELIVQKRAELGTDAGQQAVWGDTDNVLASHYTGLGNLMVALSIFAALGYDLATLDLSNIPTGDVSATDKALCISIIQGF